MYFWNWFLEREKKRKEGHIDAILSTQQDLLFSFIVITDAANASKTANEENVKKSEFWNQFLEGVKRTKYQDIDSHLHNKTWTFHL